MKRSRIFVLPTYFDTGPLVVGESMAMGVPVIAYGVEGLPWMLGDGKHGVLVTKGDVGALAAEIEALMADNARMERYAVEAHAFARTHFYAPEVAENLTRIYRDVLRSTGQSQKEDPS